MTNKTNSKGSARKKLIPAVGMLTVSAMMLSSATYAWFTMAREVEVTNIQMTASVPADLQISLGMLSNLGDAKDSHGLVDNWGTLVPAELTSADNGGVAAPTDDARYWSNTADLSAYYALGKIMPASSTDGLNLYFTPDASGVGKTLKTDAKYYAAVEGANIKRDSVGGAYMTTLHAYTAKTAADASIATDVTAWTAAYKKAKEYNLTNDDGYFVDIPVWIRSSNTEANVNLSVDAYVTTNSKHDDDDLYLAARAVILNDVRTATSGLIEIKEGSYSAYVDPTAAVPVKKDSIVNFMSTTNSTGAAVKSLVNDEDPVNGNAATYGLETYYDGTTTNSGVVVKRSNTEGQYGEPTKVWIRVWLEGEDPNCWNENAGQDFNISLKFSRDDVELPNPKHYDLNTANGAEASTLNAGAETLVKYPGSTEGITFVYDGTKWDTKEGEMFNAPTLGNKYKIQGVSTVEAFDSLTALKNYVNSGVISTNAFATTGLQLVNDPILGRRQIAYIVKGGTGSWSVDTAETNVLNYTYNGTNYADRDAVATAIDTGTNGNYAVTINYTNGAPVFTVTYTDLTIEGATAPNNVLKLMRMATTITTTTEGDNPTSTTTTTYKWYIAGENTYKIPTGANVTTTGSADDVTELAGFVNALNSGNNETTTSVLGNLAQVAVPKTEKFVVAVQGDPSARSIYLTRTISAGTTTWALTSNSDIPDGATQYSLDSGAKLKWNNADYEALDGDGGLIAAISAGGSNSTPVISYVAPATP